MGYAFSRTVTIDHFKVPNTDQSNFPLLFSGTYAYLATVANGGNVISASGFDIIFTSDAAGATKLDHEIESYNPVTGAVNFWVRVPTVATATDTVIYLWYGNADITISQENVTGVWDANFKAVWHLKEAAGGSGAIKDSTSNANHLTDNGGPTFGGAGQINGAISFDGSNDYLSVAASIVPTGNNVKSVSAWFKSVTTISTRQWLFYAGTETTRGRFAMEIESSKLNLNYQSASLVGATTLVSGQWYYGVIVSDGSLIKVYLNGAQDASGSPAGGVLNTGTTINTLLAAFLTPSLFLNGLMDEIRVSNSVRSADWIATEYNNQFSPSTFYAVRGLLVDGIAAIELESGSSHSNIAEITLESGGRIPERLAQVALESWANLSYPGLIPLQSGATSSHPASVALESTLNLPISESATIVHRRRILSPFLARMLHERTILASAPPLPSIIHTRSIFRSFLPMIHSRTIVPRATILHAGLIESGNAQGGSLTTVILASDASSTNGFYVGMWITIDGEQRRITAYNGTTKTATVAALTSPPIAGTPYSITVAKPGASKVLRPFAEVTEA